MKFTNLFDDKRAVSPVIGVILMVAITVILAAVIGTFVLGLSDQVQETSPRVSFGFDASAGNVEITHESGDRIESDLSVKYQGQTTGDLSESWSASKSSPITAGDSYTTNESVVDGTTLRVIWTGDGGDSSTLGKYNA